MTRFGALGRRITRVPSGADLAAWRKQLDHIEKFALRTRSPVYLDILASLAAGTRVAHEHFPSSIADWGAFARLARVSVDLADDRASCARALGLLRTLRDHVSIRGMRAVDAIALADLLTQSGSYDEARQTLKQAEIHEAERACLEANLLLVEGSRTDRWLEAFNRVFGIYDLEAAILTGSRSFPSLGAPTVDYIRDGPLISVITPAFNCADTLAFSSRSILAQSWRNIELIIVDDASTDATAATAGALAEVDPRVRVVRLPSNAGTYAARNHALEVAQGSFITTHDADDWAHPRRLERQVRALLEQESAIGNLGSWIRADERLRLHRFSGSGTFLYPNISSLMFRREALNKAGPWDVVRKGADSEFVARLERTFSRLPVDPAPTALGRLGPNTLTSGELGRGFETSSRRHYRLAWRHWHARASQPQMSANPRPFPLPYALRGVETVATAVFDFVLVADFRFQDDVFDLLIDELHEVAGSVRIGLVELLSCSPNAAGDDWTENVHELLARNEVVMLSPDDEVECRSALWRATPPTARVDPLKLRCQQLHAYGDSFQWAKRESEALFGRAPNWHHAKNIAALAAKLIAAP